MSEEHRVSRRASLKGLGAVGAAVALSAIDAPRAAASQAPAQAQPATQPDVVNLALARFGKGHS